MDAVALRDQIAAAASRAAADFLSPPSDAQAQATAVAYRDCLTRFALACGLDPAAHVFDVEGTLQEGRVDLEVRVSETFHERLAVAGLTPAAREKMIGVSVVKAGPA